MLPEESFCGAILRPGTGPGVTGTVTVASAASLTLAIRYGERSRSTGQKVIN